MKEIPQMGSLEKTFETSHFLFVVRYMLRLNISHLHGCTMHQQYQTLYSQINALNYINCTVIKTH